MNIKYDYYVIYFIKTNKNMFFMTSEVQSYQNVFKDSHFSDLSSQKVNLKNSPSFTTG